MKIYWPFLHNGINLLISLFIVTVSAVGCSTVTSTDSAWEKLTRTDLEFVYQTIKDNHPGPIDIRNPDFSFWLERGKAEGLEQSKKAKNFEAYKFTLSKYIEGFNDGHLNFWTKYKRSNYKWPSFIIAFRNGKYVVYKSEIAQIKKGDELLSCDGQNILKIYETNVFPYKGAPRPESRIYSLAPYIFVDQYNPFIKMPVSCQFKRQGKSFQYTLKYKKKDQRDLGKLIAEATFGPKGKFNFQKISKNNYWISIPTFAPDDNQVDLLKTYIKRLKKLSKTQSTLVFDVRGNSGGSSAWGDQIVESLYGQENFKKLDKNLRGNITIDWRVSKENFKSVSAWPTIFEKRFGSDGEITVWAKKFVAQFKKALNGKKLTIRQDPDKKLFPLQKNINFNRQELFKGKIYFLTDGRCGSACLDFADVVLALPNSIHVGLETAADTLYMEGNIIDPLPSGLGSLYYPMKVWRDRIRGDKESYKPKYLWTGEMSNTKGLQEWIFKKLKND